MQLKNLVGFKIGTITVTDKSYIKRDSHNMTVHYWECTCECGRVSVKAGKEIKRLKGVGCGYDCPILQDFHRQRAHLSPPPGKPKKEETPTNTLLSSYKRGARVRAYPWTLSDEEALHLFTEPCHYCGEIDMRYTKELNGIDRLDNTRGYHLDNCVPCCKICNKMKMTLTASIFINKIKQIASRL